jgi:hypothetical protein
MMSVLVLLEEAMLATPLSLRSEINLLFPPSIEQNLIFFKKGKTYKFHLIPSGILHPGTTCVIGNGVVVHIPSLIRELRLLKDAGVDYEGRIFLSDRAHLVFDFHQQVCVLIKISRWSSRYADSYLCCRLMAYKKLSLQEINLAPLGRVLDLLTLQKPHEMVE